MSLSDEGDCTFEAEHVSETAAKLADELSSKGHACDFVVRAPGRVNLIGEHIDYNGYSVLPMALEQAIHLAVSFTSPAVAESESGLVLLMNTDSSYETAKINVADAVVFGSDGPPGQLRWYHYFLSAYHGIADYVAKKNLSWSPPSMVVLVGGADFGGLWPAAGLSSSSALVVASALAVAQVAKLRIGRRELASLCAQCERYVGLQGGGMDQAACLLAQKDKAMLIEFTKPLVIAHPVTIPSDVVFVIAHCGVHSRKAATSMYNERVSECRLAAKLLIRKSGSGDRECATARRDQPPACLGDAQQVWGVESPGCMLATPVGDAMTTTLSIVERSLPAGAVSLQRLISEFSLSAEEIDGCLTATTKSMKEFRLRDRVEHVFAEAQRVFKFWDLCRQWTAGDPGDQSAISRRLGDLMNESQKSCAQLYQCSCPELDELIAICRSAGALGSRLTGAGWGGCTVSLVPRSQVTQFMDTVRSGYYAAKGIPSTLMFVSQAGSPAAVMTILRG